MVTAVDGAKMFSFIWLIYGISLIMGQRYEDEMICHTPLGVANEYIVPNYWFASSDGKAYDSRLKGRKAWISNKQQFISDLNQNIDYAWLQIDLQKKVIVSGILTRGNSLNNAWVSNYTVWQSENCEKYSQIYDRKGNMITFSGNYDSEDIVTNLLHDVFVTRCIRIIPLEFKNAISLQFELLGCEIDLCRENVIQHMKQEEFNTSDINSTIDDFLPSSFHAKPTQLLKGYAQFKLSVEHIVFGVVFYINSKMNIQNSAFISVIITYSRNCHSWIPIREKKGFGDPLMFQVTSKRLDSLFYSFPYPIRAQCLRVIPTSTTFNAENHPEAHFIGCGTGNAIIHKCGTQKPILEYSQKRKKRMIGGTPSGIGWWPWLTSIEIRYEGDMKYTHVCGGTLIQPQFIVTAAHCMHVIYTSLKNDYTLNYTKWNDPDVVSRIRVRVGEHGNSGKKSTQVMIKVEQIMAHSDYNISFFTHDIAVLKLVKPIRLTDYVNIICLPNDEEMDFYNSSCAVIGWGSTGEGMSSRPHHVEVPLISNDACQEMYSHLVITKDMQCAGSKDESNNVCSGDSGGPLVCNVNDHWYLAGIVSWNIGCGRPDYPGVYAKVSTFVDWIENSVLNFENN